MRCAGIKVTSSRCIAGICCKSFKLWAKLALARWTEAKKWIDEKRGPSPDEFDDDAPMYEIAAKARELPLTNRERREQRSH
mgnify:CR=1 FL=1